MVLAMSSHLNITEIIKHAGGASAIASASLGAIKKDAVYKWPAIGAPDRHWAMLISLCASNGFHLRPEDLFHANLDARSAKQVAA